MSVSNGVIIAQLALQSAFKLQELLALNAKAAANGGDVSDEDVANSKVARDVQLAKTEALGHEESKG